MQHTSATAVADQSLHRPHCRGPRRTRSRTAHVGESPCQGRVIKHHDIRMFMQNLLTYLDSPNALTPSYVTLCHD
jgi:hypothetical protein